MKHQLHKVIGRIIKNNFSDEGDVILDRAYDGKQNIPLFSSRKKSRAQEICNVDILILKSNKIKVIIEIEETNIKPTQICGKFLTSALSTYYIHRNKKAVDMEDPVLFVQVLDTSELKKDKTSKIKQWKNLEELVESIIPIKNSKIRKYKIFYGEASNFDSGGEKAKILIDYIRKFLRPL